MFRKLSTALGWGADEAFVSLVVVTLQFERKWSLSGGFRLRLRLPHWTSAASANLSSLACKTGSLDERVCCAVASVGLAQEISIIETSFSLETSEVGAILLLIS